MCSILVFIVEGLTSLTRSVLSLVGQSFIICKMAESYTSMPQQEFLLNSASGLKQAGNIMLQMLFIQGVPNPGIVKHSAFNKRKLDCQNIFVNFEKHSSFASETMVYKIGMKNRIGKEYGAPCISYRVNKHFMQRL